MPAVSGRVLRRLYVTQLVISSARSPNDVSATSVRCQKPTTTRCRRIRRYFDVGPTSRCLLGCKQVTRCTGVSRQHGYKVVSTCYTSVTSDMFTPRMESYIPGAIFIYSSPWTPEHLVDFSHHMKNETFISDGRKRRRSLDGRRDVVKKWLPKWPFHSKTRDYKPHKIETLRYDYYNRLCGAYLYSPFR